MASRVASLGYMQTGGFITFIASDLNEIFSLTLAPRLMKTCYYTCHVASHQKQPQPILGPQPPQEPSCPCTFHPCKIYSSLLNFGGAAHSPDETLALARRPRPALYPCDPNGSAGARGLSPSQKHFKLTFCYSFKRALAVYMS